jgi:predicted ATPase/class 3 adenylate cyclase
MALPTGPAVTFLFTDIEGSTRFERAVGAVAWASLVARHDALLRGAIEGHGGVVVKTEGDAFFAAFEDPGRAVAAAVAAQRAIGAEAWVDGAPLRIRMGLHLGEGRLRQGRAESDPEDYVGIDVNYTARIAAAGNGGQVVLSDALVGALPRDIGRLPGIGDVELADEGPRTVKDFDEPARLYRLVVPGVADDPRPLRTIEAPSNLPGEVTPLVGRDEEIGRLARELDQSRIVTLTGPGGSGKTRLALGVARDIRAQFPDGAWFVDLAAVRDPGLLESTIAATMGVKETPEMAAGEALHAQLRDRIVLLLLDNLEQLLPRAAEIVARLVRAAPRVKVIVTSRELLRIAGERGHPVPPLALDAGVALFVDRARALRPDLVLAGEALSTVAAICERLAGLPLAIELAAARVRLLSPALILDRLGQSLDLGGGARDLPERQRTLRGAIAWSHDLLTPEERRLFARLSVFAGGGTPAAALAVADADGDLGVDLLAGLESLADKSLIRIEVPGGGSGEPDAALAAAGVDDGESRFTFHPLLREFAFERLDESGERSIVEARFEAEFVSVAEAAGAEILGPTGETAMRRLDREDHNLRAAIELAMSRGDLEPGLRIVGSIWRWYQQRGRLREARALLAQLLAPTSNVDVRVRIRGLAAEGGLAYWMNDAAAARAAYDERLSLAESTGDDTLIADAHYDIGFLFMITGEVDRLLEHEQLALDLYTAAGDVGAANRARQALVLAVFHAGDYRTAAELEQRNLDVFRASGSHFQVADSMTLLSAVHWRLGETAIAWRWLTDALRFFVGIDSSSGLARSLGMAAIVLIADGDAELGTRVAGAVYRLVRDHGVMLAPVQVLHLPDPAELARERLGAERADALLDEGAALAIEAVVARVLAEPPPDPTTR